MKLYLLWEGDYLNSIWSSKSEAEAAAERDELPEYHITEAPLFSDNYAVEV